MQSQTCGAVSEKDAQPWRFISREQSQLACVRVGKRLPTASEWHSVALGTSDASKNCNTEGEEVTKTGAYKTCSSALGIFDAVGNVWEWTTDDIFNATYQDRPLPEEGYVTQVDNGGVATVTGDASEAHGGDYFWSKKEGVFAVTRGGFYGSGEDAGVYAVHAAMDPNIAGAAIGFRCVK